MQAGMLFHAVSGGDLGVDIEQIVATLHKPLDEGHSHAWERVASGMRFCVSRFGCEGVADPVQDVLDRIHIPVERFDWRALTEAERRKHFQAALDHDRVDFLATPKTPMTCNGRHR